MARQIFFLFFPAMGLALISCQSLQKDSGKDGANTYRPPGQERPLVDKKYSLSADRQALEDLRKEIPEDKRNENDEMAFVLQLIAEVKRPPSDIRNKFDSVVRKKREVFNKDLQKEREEFTKKERKSRETFLAEQKKTRESFMKEKYSREQKTEFFKDQDAKRTEYFANERDRRADFESDVRERRKNFEDYAKEKRDSFNQDMKSYTQKYDEMKKQQREKEQQQNQIRGSEVQGLDAEINRERTRSGEKLESGQ